MADFVKANDDEYLAQVEQFYNFINRNPEAYGFTRAEVDELNGKNTTFGNSLTSYNTKQTEIRAARLKKDDDRDPSEEMFRWMAGQFNKRPNVTNADRVSAGLQPRSESSGRIEPDLSTPPLLLVEQTGIHEHRIRFYIPSENAASTKKPQGVDFAGIYLKIDGEPVADLKQYQLMTEDRKSPYQWTHEAEDAGKTAHYIAVWGTDEGARSSQSEVFSLKIT